MAMIKQQMVLVIARSNINVSLLQPLQIIIPTLALAAPFSLYTSTCERRLVGDNLFDALVENLKTQGKSSLTNTLKNILQERKNTNKFRVCVIGSEKVNWDIALEYKRKEIMIDVVGNNAVLNQISYTTGGIAKEVKQEDMIRQFLTVFSMSKEIRKLFQLQENKKVSFNLQCRMCKPSHFFTEQFRACSVCLEVLCPEKAFYLKTCPKCKTKFDEQPKMESCRSQYESNVEI